MLTPHLLVSERENLQKIKSAVYASTNLTNFYQNIVDAPFSTLLPASYDLGTIVLLIDDPTSGFIERVALSQTPAAEGAVRASALPFEDIRIPRNYKESAHVKALETKKPVIVTDWHCMFAPVLTAEQARDNQHGSGILTSIVYPFFSRINGTIIFSLYSDKENISDKAHQFFEWYRDFISHCANDLHGINSIVSKN